MKIKKIIEECELTTTSKKVHKIINELKQKGQVEPIHDFDGSWLWTNLMLVELLNPSNAYEYVNQKNEIWYFTDATDIKFYAIMVAYPGKIEPFYEFKTWWIDPDTNQRVYTKLPDTTTRDLDRRSDTVAKIFRDEIIPKFKNQTYAEILVFNPADSPRYHFSLRMIKKFIPKDWEIEENYPKRITIRKST